jgi:hypothetical protein
VPYRVTAYLIRTLARDQRPYVETIFPSTAVPALHDANGIPMKQVGTGLYYSPTGLAQSALRFEDAYRRGHDPKYLALATKYLAKLISLGTMSNGGLYIHYDFDWPMHANPKEVLRAPWYSAMAQGLALSLAVRLFLDTGDPSFRANADLLFATFRHLGRGTSPWVTYVDADRYLWLEEYPEPWTPSDHTANGFNFALFGLYDYFELTHSSTALQILRGSLTTMRHFIAAYRNPGTYSDYCLRHGKPQIKYHEIVTWQLEFLARMSGDSYFHTMSLAFKADYP